MRIVLIMLTFYILNLQAFGSCLVKIEKGKEYRVSIWRHSENATPDDVAIRYMPETEMDRLPILMKDHKSLSIIFNEGVFTSLKFSGTGTKRWESLSEPERGMVEFISRKFDTKEK